MSLGEYIGPLISSSLVNFSLFSNIYAPFDVINYTNGEGADRYSKVKAIRIQKADLVASEVGSIRYWALKIGKAHSVLSYRLKVHGIDNLKKYIEQRTKLV